VNLSGSNDKVTLASVTQDRLGSIGKFYPYGTERPSATQNDTEKFAGYFRDASTGLDYADQRYHQPGTGRFMTPDSAPSANPNDPGSWNTSLSQRQIEGRSRSDGEGQEEL
jgi:RHS repeat-associated protein